MWTIHSTICCPYMGPYMDHIWDHIWTIYGTISGPYVVSYMARIWYHIWTIHGPCLDHMWSMCGPYMDHICSMYGPYMVHIWSIYAPCMDHIWTRSLVRNLVLFCDFSQVRKKKSLFSDVKKMIELARIQCPFLHHHDIGVIVLLH